jgi:serine/threonine protein kinase
VTQGLPNIPPGTILAGKYRVDRVLGSGGMGVVCSATHVGLDQPVAIKFLRPEAMANAESLERFLREARAAVRLRGEHVARVTDVGTLENGAPYMVMELLVGEDLTQMLTRLGALPAHVAVTYILQACEAIAEAHQLGIIHRDIKPSNLFVTQSPDGQPQVKVLDFGISKQQANDVSSLTSTTAVMGTPCYMPPEQLRASRFVDQRGDIWALAICLYELIAGRRPYDGETFSEVCVKISVDAPPPLHSALGEEVAGIDGVVTRCLQKDPSWRYQSIAELAWALAPFAGDAGWASAQKCSRLLGGQVMGNPPRPMSVRHEGPPTTMRGANGEITSPNVVSARQTRSKGGSKKTPVILGAAVVLVGVIAGAIGLGISDSKQAAVTPAAPPVVETPEPVVPAEPVEPKPEPVEVTPPPAPQPVATPPATPDAGVPDAGPPDAGTLEAPKTEKTEKKKKKKQSSDDIFNSRE